MDEPAQVFLYGSVKLFAYVGWCLVGLRLSAPEAQAGGRGLWWRALWLGSLRWLLGLMFGVVLFFAFATEADRVWTQYVLVYVPVRFVEWGLIGLFLLSPRLRLSSPRFYAWIALGILVSFASDLTSPEMIERGRFCVGRCLC